jgi:hypothetical protein
MNVWNFREWRIVLNIINFYRQVRSWGWGIASGASAPGSRVDEAENLATKLIFYIRILIFSTLQVLNYLAEYEIQ